MFITFLTNQAQKNYAKHWWFLFVSLIGMSAIFGTFVLGDEKSFATIVLLMSIVVGYWALLCMYVCMVSSDKRQSKCSFKNNEQTTCSFTDIYSLVCRHFSCSIFYLRVDCISNFWFFRKKFSKYLANV